MKREEPWLASDKVYHAIRFRSICLLLAGAAKEITTVVVAGLLSSPFAIVYSTTTGSALTTCKHKFVASPRLILAVTVKKGKPDSQGREASLRFT